MNTKNDIREKWSKGVHSLESDHMTLTEYIGKYFKYPELIVAAMADDEVAIVGKRALEFFRPGSCGEREAWQFVSPRTNFSVNAIVAALYHCGVDWRGSLFEMQRAIFDMKSGRMSFTDTCITKYSLDLYELDYIDSDSISDRRLLSLLEAVRIWREMQDTKESKLDIRKYELVYDFSNGSGSGSYTIISTPIEDIDEISDIDFGFRLGLYHPNGKGVDTMHGSLRIGNKDVTISVRCTGTREEYPDPIPELHQYCGSTITMCSLTAFYGVHMFYSHAQRDRCLAVRSKLYEPMEIDRDLPSGVRQIFSNFIKPEFIHVNSIQCKYYRFEDLKQVLKDKYNLVEDASMYQQMLVEETSWRLDLTDLSLQFEHSASRGKIRDMMSHGKERVASSLIGRCALNETESPSVVDIANHSLAYDVVGPACIPSFHCKPFYWI